MWEKIYIKKNKTKLETRSKFTCWNSEMEKTQMENETTNSLKIQRVQKINEVKYTYTCNSREKR